MFKATFALAVLLWRSRVGPPLAKAEHELPSLGGRHWRAYQWRHNVGFCRTSDRRHSSKKPGAIGFWTLVTAGDIVAWRVKWLAIPIRLRSFGVARESFRSIKENPTLHRTGGAGWASWRLRRNAAGSGLNRNNHSGQNATATKTRSTLAKMLSAGHFTGLCLNIANCMEPIRRIAKWMERCTLPIDGDR